MGAHLASVYVSVDGRPRVVSCSLADTRDVEEITAWRKQTTNRDTDARDALEFAKLAGKRWKFYVSRRRAASSLKTACAHVRREPMAELAFIVVLTAKWAPHQILGMSLFRRSWCNNLIVDFIAGHPANWDTAGPEIRGVLRAIFAGIAHVAIKLHSKRIWGEATDSSSAKYQHTFDLASADDLFIIEPNRWRKFLGKVQHVHQ